MFMLLSLSSLSKSYWDDELPSFWKFRGDLKLIYVSRYDFFSGDLHSSSIDCSSFSYSNFYRKWTTSASKSDITFRYLSEYTSCYTSCLSISSIFSSIVFCISVVIYRIIYSPFSTCSFRDSTFSVRHSTLSVRIKFMSIAHWILI